MGRVARYKKVKSFDPYSKQNGGRINLNHVGVWGLGSDVRKTKKRSRTSEKLRSLKRKRGKDGGDNTTRGDPHGLDTAPEGGDDFDLADLVGSLKKKSNSPFKNESIILSATAAAAPEKTKSPEQALKEERKVHRLLKIEQQEEEKKRKEMEQSMERVEGEKKWDYRKRVRKETGQAIRKERIKNSNSQRQQKKKEFMNNKRKKKKDRGKKCAPQVEQNDSDSGDEQDTLITGEAAVAATQDVVLFGEQAERPPTFRQLPRGAKAKAEIDEQTNKTKKPKLMQEEDVRAEHYAMEKMRAKVQAQYALVRKRRNGAFHL